MRGIYDFETTKWTRPIFVGLKWVDEWFSYLDRKKPEPVVDFALDTMRLLAKHEDVTEWWAHNGGNFDALILLEAADRRGWKIEASAAQGGRIVRMTLKPGARESFTLLDSYAVVPSALKKACEDFGLKARKLFTGADYSGDMADLPREKLEAGCRADCEAVAELLDTVESHLIDWQGKLKATFSSCALSCAKSAAIDSMGRWETPTVDANEFARQSYCGGRVEVFHHAPDFELREYDVTSSYPWSMSQALPWKYLERSLKPSNLDFEGIVEAEIEQPPCAIPVLPVKDTRGGLYFPVGKWTGIYTAAELRYAISQGVNVRPISADIYQPAKPFNEFVTRAFSLKETSTGAARQFAKLVLNGSYGKAAEKPEKEKLVVYPTEQEAQEALMAAAKEERSVRVLSKEHSRFQLATVFHWPKHTHFALASYITAYSRILLHQHLKAVPQKRLAYCDTDSVHGIKTEALEERVNKDLGGLKIEIKRMRGEYYAPKLYRLKDLDTGKEHLASKGFPVDAAEFKRIVKGEKIFRAALVKVKGQLARHANQFTRLEGEHAPSRTWAGRSAKRKPFADGSTEPWTYKELMRGVHLEALSPLVKKPASR